MSTITFGNDLRFSTEMSNFGKVYFTVDGVVMRFVDMSQELQDACDAIYPVTFDARQLAKRKAAEQGRAVDAPQAGA